VVSFVVKSQLERLHLRGTVVDAMMSRWMLDAGLSGGFVSLTIGLSGMTAAARRMSIRTIPSSFAALRKFVSELLAVAWKAGGSTPSPIDPPQKTCHRMLTHFRGTRP
jgi:hypothetical protein